MERSYQRLTRDDLSVWNDSHPRPQVVSDFETRLLSQINRSAQQQLEALRPHDAVTFGNYREVVGGAWDVLLRNLPDQHHVRFGLKSKWRGLGFEAALGLLSYRTVEAHDAELPMITLTPDSGVRNTLIWISDQGKARLFDQHGLPRTAVAGLLADGCTVIGIDLYGQGEFLNADEPARRQRSLPGEEGFGGWTYCYNLPLFARRVHDILALVHFARESDPSGTLDIIGLGPAGPLVAAALVQSKAAIDGAALDTRGFRFARLQDVYDSRFLPGAARYGDIPGLLSLAAPQRLWLAGETHAESSLISAAWRAQGKQERITWYAGDRAERDALQWLLDRGKDR